jgi:DNA-binding HxlR family transcriptional regulator
MVLIRGFIEILQIADSGDPKHFNDFTKIMIKKKRLSSATVSKRLAELIAVRVLDEVVSRSKTGRRIVAYRATSKGKKVIALAKELEEALSTPKGR